MFSLSPEHAVKVCSKVNAKVNAKVTAEVGVFEADPHQLINLLFDGAIKAISNAIQQTKEKDIPAKDLSITHAALIIESGLRTSLNKTVSGELAHNLDTLYRYLAKELGLANTKNDINKFVEVKKSLMELRDSWLQIVPAKEHQAEPVNVGPVDTLIPHTASYYSA